MLLKLATGDIGLDDELSAILAGVDPVFAPVVTVLVAVSITVALSPPFFGISADVFIGEELCAVTADVANKKKTNNKTKYFEANGTL